MTRTTWAALGSLLALAACGDGQTGSDYRGEPLMSLTGVVTSSSAPLSGLVPALHFISMDDFYAHGTAEYSTYFVDSEVEGTFPSAFTMRVYDPPPDEALFAWFDGEPAVASGLIAAVSPGHPRWLRRSSRADPLLDDAGVQIGETQYDELCSDTGECVGGYPAECPEGEHDQSREWPCGAAFPDGLPWEVYGYSERYSVMYFDGDVPAGSVTSRLYGGGETIAAGYHGARRVDVTMLSPEQVTERTECFNNAYARANELASAMFGADAQLANVTRQLDLMRLQYVALAELGCASSVELVDPGSEPIDLLFTDEPQRFVL